VLWDGEEKYMDKLLYGAAYYDEYMPYDRLDRDIEMMKAAGMNVVRIAESTWATYEPQPGIFDFSHVTRVIDAMEKAGIYVIVGTPTYAIPSWMEKMHPEVMAIQQNGRHIYGARQSMDITNPTYLFYAERVIRKLLEVTAHRKCVIGFQLDNETKYYGSAGNGIQRLFVKYLREKFSVLSDSKKAGEAGQVGTVAREAGTAGQVGAVAREAGTAGQVGAASGEDGTVGRRLSDDEALERMNQAFGLDYWSNRINSWEDFPDVRGTINGSLAAEFDKFRRGVVNQFLGWQASIVREYMRDDQFLTHNFDFGWKNWSYGVQPLVNHFRLAKTLAETGAGDTAGVGERRKPSRIFGKVNGQTITGCDIYHPSQSELTGTEIAFGGDLNRSLLNKNYLILETEAQGYPCWTPYPGQLRLQAYSHLASGADMVEYWHWHSIHNSFETYWKGVLSHDFEENDVYREAKVIGNEWRDIGSHLLHLKKQNRVAILVSNEALTTLGYFKIDAISGDTGKAGYNDVLRRMYDALYQMNIECDFVCPDALAAFGESALEGSGPANENLLSRYRLLVVPALYSAPEPVLSGINRFAEKGGIVIETFKSGFTDENVKVWTDAQPHILKNAAGVIYHEFAFPKEVRLKGKLMTENACKDEQTGFGNKGGADASDEYAELFMELLEPRVDGKAGSGEKDEGEEHFRKTEVLLSYDHPAWKKYAAVTRNRYGKGVVYYIGCGISSGLLKKLYRMAAKDAGIRVPEDQWPVTVRKGTNQYDREITYLLNYSGDSQDVVWDGAEAILLLGEDHGRKVSRGETVSLHSWDLQIFEEK